MTPQLKLHYELAAYFETLLTNESHYRAEGAAWNFYAYSSSIMSSSQHPVAHDWLYKEKCHANYNEEDCWDGLGSDIDMRKMIRFVVRTMMKEYTGDDGRCASGLNQNEMDLMKTLKSVYASACAA